MRSRRVSGPLVLLVHGFPESWYSWRHQLGAVAAADQDYFGGMTAVIDEFESDLRGWIRDELWSLSGDYLSTLGIDLATMDPVALIRASAMCVPQGQTMRARFGKTETLPAWISEADVDFYAGKFQRSGMSGPLSFCNQMTASWQFLEAHADKPLTVPALCVIGALDIVYGWSQGAIARAKERIPLYAGTKVLKGFGHWQQERPQETNAAILEFLSAIR